MSIAFFSEYNILNSINNIDVKYLNLEHGYKNISRSKNYNDCILW